MLHRSGDQDSNSLVTVQNHDAPVITFDSSWINFDLVFPEPNILDLNTSLDVDVSGYFDINIYFLF